MRIGQARTVSVRPTLLQHRRHGLHEQLDVPAQAPAGDVHVVQLHHLVEGDITPPEHLPQPGDAGRDVEALLRPAAALLSLFHPQGPRPDQTHLALHDIDDLRQLVHAPAPQPAADARDARVAFDLEHRSVVVILVGEIVAQLVSAQVHGAELVDVEGPPSLAHPLLTEEHGAARVELDHKRDDAEHRQHEHADHAADYEIEGALDGHVEATELDMGDVEGIPLLDVTHVELSRFNMTVKRAFDLVVGGVICMLVLPVLGIVALMIKLDSRGPVFFRQERMGRGGRPFYIYKFRSMYLVADKLRDDLADQNDYDGPMFKIKRDPRVTRIGGWLRRWSVDELPQIINVMKGDMSLVGPRPLWVDEAKQCRGWTQKRLDITPGITGLWQVLGRSDIPFEEMVKLDYMYVTGWSLSWDIKLLLQTVPAVVQKRGAY